VDYKDAGKPGKWLKIRETVVQPIGGKLRITGVLGVCTADC